MVSQPSGGRGYAGTMRKALLLGALALGLGACTVSVRPNVSLEYSGANLISGLSPDRGTGASYSVGERVRLRLTTRVPGYVTLVSLDPDGHGNVLVRGAYVGAGTTVFPRPQDGVTYDLRPPRGLQRVRAIFTTVRPTSTIIFSGRYDLNRWNDATTTVIQPYQASERDIFETYFYIR